MIRRLGIEDDEIDDLVFEDEVSAPKQGMKWMALARVHTSNFFSPQTFEQHMKIAWSPAKEIRFEHIEGNLFSVQCFCLGDWLKVEKGGPWLFRQNIVCIEEYDGLSDPETVDLNSFATYIQIHKLPIGYRTDALIKNLTEKKVGKVIGSVETNVNGMGNFVRVRVKLHVDVPLARFVTVSRAGQREFYQVKYEKMPKFCGACGLVGHIHTECGTGEIEEDKLKWGEFLKADWSTWKGRSVASSRGGGRADRGGRSHAGRAAGRGADLNSRGRGAMTSWRHNTLPFSEDYNKTEGSLEDTATSPGKKGDLSMLDGEEPGDVENIGAKRRLLLQSEPPLYPEQTIPDTHADMAVDTTSETENDLAAGAFERPKRSKKDGADSPSLGSADSFEGSVRAQ
jgi:hypothetical protein